MDNRKQQTQDRAAKVAAMRAEAASKDRRRKVIIFGTAGAVVVGLVAAVAVPLVSASRERAAIQAAVDAPIEGVQEFDGLSANHVAGAAEYPSFPPVGGDHDAAWLNCGIYDEPVPTGNAVHSLEHGAVWIAYDPKLPADQVALLRQAVQGEAYAILAPSADVAAPVVMSAWGRQLELNDAADPRLPVFLEKYLQGEQTPEPGAVCVGGVGTPVA